MKNKMQPTLSVSHLYYDVPITIKAKFHAYLHHRLLRKPRDWDQMPGYKRILRDINFKIYPGEFVAIIGPSGSGKTSLINILANRVITETYCGEVKLKGKQLGPWIKPYLGYVQQEDTLYATDTARETLQFTANLKLKGDSQMKKSIIDSIINSLNLSHVADQLMGAAAGQGFDASNVKTGLSGGERRRVSIANEIISSPRLLLLDECTSGLDTSTATTVVSTLRKIADSRYSKDVSRFLESNTDKDPSKRGDNITVMATLHQPSSFMWNLFDKILVLASGRTIFYGRPEHFWTAMHSIGYQVPPSYNPADYLIEVVSKDENKFPHCYEDRLDLIRAISQTFDVDQNITNFIIEQANNSAKERAGTTLTGVPGLNTVSVHNMRADVTEGILISEDSLKIGSGCRTPSSRQSPGSSIRHDFGTRTLSINGSEVMITGTTIASTRTESLEMTESIWKQEMFTDDASSIKKEGHMQNPARVRSFPNLKVGPIEGSVEVQQYFTKVLKQTRLDAYMKRREGGVTSPLTLFSDSLFEILDYRTKYAQPYYFQFITIYLRFLRFCIREPSRLLAFVFQYVFFALFAGSLFWRLGTTMSELNNRVGALFFVQTCMAFAPASESALRVFQCRQTYHREHASGTYATLPFYVAMILTDIPIYIILVLVYGAITYFMIGFNTTNIGRWFYFMGLCFMTLIASVSFSHIFITMFGSYRVAQIILMVVISVIIVFAGPYINTKTIPVYYIWAPWVSYFAYAFKGFFYNEIIGLSFTCDDGVPEASCPVQTDKDAIAYYGLGDYSLVGALFLAYGFLTGWTLVCFVISYFLLRYRRFS